MAHKNKARRRRPRCNPDDMVQRIEKVLRDDEPKPLVMPEGMHDDLPAQVRQVLLTMGRENGLVQ